MMHDGRPLAPVQRRNRRDGPAGGDRAVAATAPVQRLEAKSFGADPVAMVALARRDDDFEPGIPRRPRDRQAVRPEIPVLGDEKDQLRPRARRARRLIAQRLVNRSVARLQASGQSGDICRQCPEPAGGPLPIGRILFNPSTAPSLAETAERDRLLARILVTGAGGFIGHALCPVLVARGQRVVAGLRRPAQGDVPGAESRLLGDIAPGRDWGGDLRDLDIVIHLAQRAHVPPSERILSAEPAAAAALARAAALSGVRRFLYVSSIKAMGETTAPGRPFRPDDTPLPGDAYGHAKLATERALATVAAETGLELAILRPPLVYGPGVGGNFRALLRLARSGLPLPFAGLDNRRSLIARDNLVDLIATVSTHPLAFQAGRSRILLGRDGADPSIPDVIRILATAQGRNAKLFALSTPVFAGLRRLPRVGPAVRRLTLSLQVDDSPTRAELGWQPPVTAEAALAETARAFASG